MSIVANFFPINSVFDKDYKPVDLRKHFKGKKIGLLFSAYWCKPCREMSPYIIKYYLANNGGKEFEIIYVSGDVNEAAFREYFAKMPWLALNFFESEVNEYLKNMFDIQKLPSLVVIDGETGKILIKNALVEEIEEIKKKTSKPIAAPVSTSANQKKE